MRGERVLVTCWQGRNRSALVAALALYLLSGADGGGILRHIQGRRPGALTNPVFAHAVRSLPARV